LNDNAIFVLMKRKSYTKKIAAAMLLIMVAQVAFASLSFSGIADENTKNSKYSLKNLGNYSNKAFSLSHLRATLQYKGSIVLNQKTNTAGIRIKLLHCNTIRGILRMYYLIN